MRVASRLMAVAAIPLSFFQKALNLPFGTGTSKSADRVGGYGNDSSGISFNGPLQSRVGADMQFLSDL